VSWLQAKAQLCFMFFYSSVITMMHDPINIRLSPTFRFAIFLYTFLCSPMCGTCPSHPIILQIIILMSGNEYRLCDVLCSVYTLTLIWRKSTSQVEDKDFPIGYMGTVTTTLTVLYRWDTGFLARRNLADENRVQIGTHSTNRNC